MTPDEVKAYAKGLRDGAGFIKDHKEAFDKIMRALEEMQIAEPVIAQPLAPIIIQPAQPVVIEKRYYPNPWPLYPQITWENTCTGFDSDSFINKNTITLDAITNQVESSLLQ